MTTAINLSGYGKFNVTRVTKMLNAANKEEATKLGKFDRFAESFRWNKKYDKLCVLYDDLHAGIDSESTAPEAKQESNLNRIVIFYRMEQLA
ncbi:MAG: outer protein, partial [Pseudomonadota bacterium]|nr:outer protein [Pseudomonadota bacterium]